MSKVRFGLAPPAFTGAVQPRPAPAGADVSTTPRTPHGARKGSADRDELDDDDDLLADKADKQKHKRNRDDYSSFAESSSQISSTELDEDYITCCGVSPYRVLKTICSSIFIVMDVERSGPLAKFYSVTSKMVVLMAVLVYVMSTHEAFRYVPDTCDSPKCNDDLLLCPGYMICESAEDPDVLAVENFTTYFFTAEYLLRLLTCWAVSPRVAGVVSAEWEEMRKLNRKMPQPSYSAPYQMWKFMLRSKNLIDLASVFPSYVQYFGTSGASTNFVRTLRLLRLVRILRLLRLLSFLKNVDVAMELISATLRQSSLMLSVFLFFVLVVIIVFGCLVFIAEQGTLTVTRDYPNGAYLRPSETGQGSEVEVSPVTSAVQGIYWAIGTATGNDVLTTTTDFGKALKNILDIVGVLGLAFPVGVICSELDRAYTKHFRRLKALSDARQRELLEEASKAKESDRARVAHLVAAMPAVLRPLAHLLLGVKNNEAAVRVGDKGLDSSVNGGQEGLLGGEETEEERAARAAHNYLLGMKFRKALALFEEGHFPPFPEGTRLALAQAKVAAEGARAAAVAMEREVTERKKAMWRQQRRWAKAVAAAAAEKAKKAKTIKARPLGPARSASFLGGLQLSEHGTPDKDRDTKKPPRLTGSFLSQVATATDDRLPSHGLMTRPRGPSNAGAHVAAAAAVAAASSSPHVGGGTPPRMDPAPGGAQQQTGRGLGPAASAASSASSSSGVSGPGAPNKTLLAPLRLPQSLHPYPVRVGGTSEDSTSPSMPANLSSAATVTSLSRGSSLALSRQQSSTGSSNPPAHGTTGRGGANGAGMAIVQEELESALSRTPSSNRTDTFTRQGSRQGLLASYDGKDDE